MLEKVLGVEKNLGDGLSRLDTADKSIIESINNNKSETMKLISLTKKEINESFESTFKKMTEEYSSLNSSFNVQIEEVNHQIKTLNDASNRHAQIMHSVELLGDKINNIDEKQPKIKAELEKLEASMLSITEKVFSLEESIVIQVEKSKFVESLNARVTQLDEMRQQSEAKSRENSESSNMKLSKEMSELKNKIETNSSTIGILGPRIDKIEVDMNRSIESVTEKIRQTSDETNNMFEKMREDMKSSLVSTEDKMNLIRNGMQSIQAENDSCFNDHELKLQKILSATEEHSNFFTAITSNMASMENKMSSYDSKQKAVTENLLITSEAQLNEFRNKFDSRITEIMRKVDSHSDQFDQNELNLVDLKRKFEENYVHTQRDLDEIRKKISNEKDSIVMKIREHKETLESFFTSLEEKIELIETTQIKESSRVEVIEKSTESLEHLSLQFEKRIKDVEKLGEDTSVLWKELSELQEYVNISREDLQSIRGYTIVLKSEGIVKKHQADVLGVYRMVDSYNDRPVYKQDGGENYIYYSSTSNTWFVGTVVGHQYGWLRNSTENASSRRWIPDLKSGWEYRPLVRSMENLDSNTWHSDDGSLKIEYLRDVEKVNELFRDIKELQKKD